MRPSMRPGPHSIRPLLPAAAAVAVGAAMVSACWLWLEASHALWATAAFGGLLMLSAALALWLRQAVTLPLRRLTGVVRELGDGNLQVRVSRNRPLPVFPADLEQLANAIDVAADSMERAQSALSAQINQATRELRQTLESVEIQNVELDIARKRALVGTRVKSEFLANMSHEIRTPINGILGFADLLIHSRLDEEQQDYVVTIKQSTANLLSLVNDILDFSRIEAGKLSIDHVAFDLRDCIEEVLSLMAPAAYGKSLKLIHLIYSDVPVKLNGDPIRIRQVLTNLIHNAIKFTRDGSIVVRVMLEEETTQDVLLRVTVTDTGIGIGVADQDNLFKAFGQADTSITRRFGGAGLGLIICQKLLQQMGGEIGLESQPEAGSTFWFTLRCNVRRELPDTSDLPDDNPLTDKRVLLYDEDVMSRLASRHILESWGMQVVEADRPDGFVARLEGGEPFDMALLGLTRSEMNGDHFSAMMQRLPGLKVPMVVLASTVDRNELRRLFQQGARVCLPKAVRRQTLFRELGRLTGAATPARIGFDKPVPMPAPVPGGRTEQAFRGLKVLVVDDNDINRKLIIRILANHGVKADEAGDGQQALERACAQDYNLIFMDIHMPVMSGEEATRLIRGQQARGKSASSRIVALTANALPAERQRLLDVDMDEHLIKPVSQEQVLHQLCLVAGIREPNPSNLPSPRASKQDGAISPGPGDGIGDADNMTLMDELRSMLLAELPVHKRAIQQAFRCGDLDDLRERVHKLHGAASVCQVPDLNAACGDLEDAITSNRRVRIPRGVSRVLGDIETLLSKA